MSARRVLLATHLRVALSYYVALPILEDMASFAPTRRTVRDLPGKVDLI